MNFVSPYGKKKTTRWERVKPCAPGRHSGHGRRGRSRSRPGQQNTPFGASRTRGGERRTSRFAHSEPRGQTDSRMTPSSPSGGGPGPVVGWGGGGQQFAGLGRAGSGRYSLHGSKLAKPHTLLASGFADRFNVAARHRWRANNDGPGAAKTEQLPALPTKPALAVFFSGVGRQREGVRGVTQFQPVDGTNRQPHAVVGRWWLSPRTLNGIGCGGTVTLLFPFAGPTQTKQFDPPAAGYSLHLPGIPLP